MSGPDDISDWAEALRQPPRPDSLEQLLASLTSELVERLRSAVELGRWPDGRRLERVELANALQLIILYEERTLPVAERTRSNLPTGCGRVDAAATFDPERH